MLNLDKHNRLRERYRQMNPSWRPATDTYATLAGPYFDSTTRALDLGCGQGGVVDQLHNPASQVTGIDVERLSLAEHRLYSTARVAAASSSLSFCRENYDLVLASWLFEHPPYSISKRFKKATGYQGLARSSYLSHQTAVTPLPI